MHALPVSLGTPVLLVAGVLYALIAWFDITRRSIPDILSGMLALLGVFSLVIVGDLPTALATLGAAAATFLCLAVLSMAGHLGGGDVKLMAASVLLVGAAPFLKLVYFTALAGGVLSLVYLAAFLVLRRRTAQTQRRPSNRSEAGGFARLYRLWRIERRRILRRSSVPYGVAIAGASFLTLVSSFA